jgi:phosphoribosylaminoimidazole-succinocarboxamide synthase
MEKDQKNVLMKTDLPLPLFIRGKVRDTYDLETHLLLIATDRISAFDVVLPVGIPRKGLVLNQISAFWFRHTASIVPNHLVEVVDDVHSLDTYLSPEQRFDYPNYLAGRSMVVKKVKRIPVECVVRGYLSGSAWAEYQEKGSVFGIKLPANMKESQELEEPIYTPTTKADTGHDLPMTIGEIEKLLGASAAQEMMQKSIQMYKYAREHARANGIIIADTKFEFGFDQGKLMLIDELLTPDSSRLWDAAKYEMGKSQPSYDKQPVRDWLVDAGWDKEPPAPELPPDVVEATSKKYEEGYEKITGRKLV